MKRQSIHCDKSMTSVLPEKTSGRILNSECGKRLGRKGLEEASGACEIIKTRHFEGSKAASKAMPYAKTKRLCGVRRPGAALARKLASGGRHDAFAFVQDCVFSAKPPLSHRRQACWMKAAPKFVSTSAPLRSCALNSISRIRIQACGRHSVPCRCVERVVPDRRVDSIPHNGTPPQYRLIMLFRPSSRRRISSKIYNLTFRAVCL